MKSILRKIFILTLALVMAVFCLTACDTGELPGGETPGGDETGGDEPGSEQVVIYSLVLEASKTDAKRGDKITLSSALKAEGKEDLPSEDAVYEIVSGKDYATILNNELTILNTAPHNAEIRVRAKEGATYSNEITVKVSVAPTSITISAGGITNVSKGQSVIITSTIAPTGADSNIVWTVLEGSEYAAFSSNILVVNNTAKTGDTIKVQASVGEVKSNEITFDIGYPLNSVAINPTGDLNILPGKSAQVSLLFDPTNATDKDFELKLVEAYDKVTIQGNVIYVAADAKIGDTFKVQAVSGTKESNILTYTVGYPLESLTVSASGVTNIALGGEATVIVTVNPTNATNGAYELVFTDKKYEAIAEIVGNVIKLKAEAKTGEIIKVKAVALDGSRESAEISYVVGYPVTSLTISANGVTNILAGESAAPTVSYLPLNATNGEYRLVITDGEDYAAIVDGVTVKVNANAVTGAVIKVKAVTLDGTKETNEISYVVGYPLVSLKAQIVDSSSYILPGASANLSVTKNPTNTTNGDYVWEFIGNGADFADIDGDKITVKETTPLNTEIQFKAVSGSISSNVITVVVNTTIESIEISSTAPAILDRGQSYPISITTTPAGASLAAIDWVVTEGADYAHVEGGKLYIASNTPAGTPVKFHAASGSISSGELSFTVGVRLESISIAIGNKTELSIEPGKNESVSVTLDPINASDTTVSWVIDEGAEYATISQNGVISVNDNKANVGKTVKFHAEILDVESNQITVTVGVVLNSLSISIDNKSDAISIDPGASKNIAVTYNPQNATLKDVEWFIEGADGLATIANGIITVASGNDNIGAELKIYAKIGEIESNKITVTIGTPITEIVISTPGKTEIVKGNTAELEIDITPSNASEKLIKWEITAGAEYATISQNNIMTVAANAPKGTTIKVRAHFNGKVYSNELTFTVMPTQEEINAEKFYISLSSNELKLDKKGASSPKIVCKVYDGNLNPVTNKELTVAINGEQYLGVNKNGYELTFTALGHGTATVTVTIAGTAVSENLTVDVIVPPEAVDLPDVFKERVDIEYAFSMKQPGSSDYEVLPFAPFIRGDALACQDYEVTFRHSSGETGNTVAVYDYTNKTITFKKTGKIIVTVSSKSGSYVNPTNSYVFNINNGYNAHTFNELQGIIESSSYNGQIINLVVTEKPVGETEYKYGYDIVPPTALKLKENQTISDLLYGPINASGGRSGLTNNRIQAVNKSLYINGNNHKIDASQMRTFTQEEYNNHLNSTEKIGKPHFNLSALLSAEPWHSSEADTEGVTKDKYWNVSLYNLEVIGNCSIDYGNQVGTSIYGSYSEGISLGKKGYTTDYYINANNLTMSNFVNGLHLASAVDNSKISNISVGNCYQNGIMIQSCLITLENMTFGPCGAGGIEVSPDESNKAGVNENQNTNVIFTGTIDAEDCVNDGNTVYFSKYTLPITTIITGNTNSLTQNQQNHILKDFDNDGDDDFIFVLLKFNNVTTGESNYSTIDYAPYDTSGKIPYITEIGETVNTTDKYIKMNIMADLGYGAQSVGEVIFYNLNYVAPEN